MTTKQMVANMTKALKAMEDLANKDNIMYESTRSDVLSVMNMCEAVSNLGHQVLGDTSRVREGWENRVAQMNSDLYPFCNTKSSDKDHVTRNEFNQLVGIVQDLSDRVASLTYAVNQLVNNPTGTPKGGSGLTCQDEPNTKSFGMDIADKNGVDKEVVAAEPQHSIISSENRQKNVEKLAQVEESIHDACLVVQNHEADLHIESKTLISVIRNWYHVRFKMLNPSQSKFRYHVESIPDYVRAIVYSFTYSTDRNAWIQEFNDWIKKVQDPNVDVVYALPYTVFETYKQIKSKLTRLISHKGLFICIWKELLSAGLNKLVKVATVPAKFSVFDMNSLVDANNRRIDETAVWTLARSGVLV